MKGDKFIIAIDGPASSGKSTTAKLVAKELNCIYIDSGSMYRAAALYLIEKNINWENAKVIKEALSDIEIEIHNDFERHENIILLNGRDVSQEIRNSNVTKLSSIVATKRVVREKMVELQRRIAESQSVVMDGRDIGTVVFPDADFKFFLTASLDERAKRRWREMNSATKTPRYGRSSSQLSQYIGNKSGLAGRQRHKKMDNISLRKIKEDLKWRDKTDSTREIAPLRMAEDAVLIDTTNLTIEEQVQKILDVVKSNESGSSKK
jgi:cytidylate kinase